MVASPPSGSAAALDAATVGYTVNRPASTVPDTCSPSSTSVSVASPAFVGVTTGLKMPSRSSLSATKRSSPPAA
jgi:hypothetical protein